jgi:penicillin-binding protein 1A
MVRQMHCGFVAMEPQTSFVRAWVGDIDFNAWKYDKVTAMRQPGSTFKLFVYAAAMEVLGLTPTDRRQDSYISIPVTDSKGKKGYWTPHNANGYCTNAFVTLRAAFARSINTIAVKLGQEAGIPYVINMAKRMGIKSKLENLPSLALGASDVTLLELIDAYCCVMNDGMQRDPILVTQIVDREGNIIYNCQNEVPLPKRAMNYRTAFYMQRLLWAGMHEPGGTTQALWEYIHCYDTEFGGKTGTSSNHSDAWFVGCSPYLVGGAWFGGEYRSIHFRTGSLGQGSRTALPIFGYFMDKVMHDSNFKHYHGKFPEMKEEILAETYEGDYEDSLEMDSLDYLLSDSDYIYSNYD